MRSDYCLLLTGMLLLVIGGCNKPTQPPVSNSPPNTTIANVPRDSSMVSAYVELHWDGEDINGYITEYQYRYITMNSNEGQTSVQPWKSTGFRVTPQQDSVPRTSLMVTFESTDSLNKQIFQVRAIDDQGEPDPTPAEKLLFTKQTQYPEIDLLIPQHNSEAFVLDETTDWWRGIQLVFTASDEDGEIMEYGYQVDDGEVFWTEDTSVYIPPTLLQEPLAGSHKLWVTARDNTGLIDSLGDSTTLKLIRPNMTKGILVIDETQESVTPGSFQDAYPDSVVDEFYSDIFGTNNSWDYQQRGVPPRDTIGQYRLIIWHADNNFTNNENVHKLPEHADLIRDYLNIGGNFIMSGWRILKSFALTERFPKQFSDGTFIHDYLNINKAAETSGYNFVGATGNGEFTDFTLDSAKVEKYGFPYNVYYGLDKINVIPFSGGVGGFSNVIYSYEGEDPAYRGEPIGLRYYGTSYNTVVFGFPMFFIKKTDAMELGHQILNNLGFN